MAEIFGPGRSLFDGDEATVDLDGGLRSVRTGGLFAEDDEDPPVVQGRSGGLFAEDDEDPPVVQGRSGSFDVPYGGEDRTLDEPSDLFARTDDFARPRFEVSDSRIDDEGFDDGHQLNDFTE